MKKYTVIVIDNDCGKEEIVIRADSVSIGEDGNLRFWKEGEEKGELVASVARAHWMYFGNDSKNK